MEFLFSRKYMKFHVLHIANRDIHKLISFEHFLRIDAMNIIRIVGYFCLAAYAALENKDQINRKTDLKMIEFDQISSY